MNPQKIVFITIFLIFSTACGPSKKNKTINCNASISCSYDKKSLIDDGSYCLRDCKMLTDKCDNDVFTVVKEEKEELKNMLLAKGKTYYSNRTGSPIMCVAMATSTEKNSPTLIINGHGKNIFFERIESNGANRYRYNWSEFQISENTLFWEFKWNGSIVY